MQVRCVSVLKDGAMPRKTSTNGRADVFAGARRCSLQEVLVQQAIAESMSGPTLVLFKVLVASTRFKGVLLSVLFMLCCKDVGLKRSCSVSAGHAKSGGDVPDAQAHEARFTCFWFQNPKCSDLESRLNWII